MSNLAIAEFMNGCAEKFLSLCLELGLVKDVNDFRSRYQLKVMPETSIMLNLILKEGKTPDFIAFSDDNCEYDRETYYGYMYEYKDGEWLITALN